MLATLSRPHSRDECISADPQRLSLPRQLYRGPKDVVRGATGIGGGLAHAANVQGNIARALCSLIGTARDLRCGSVLLFDGRCDCSGNRIDLSDRAAGGSDTGDYFV